VSQGEQRTRFAIRQVDPVRQWKLSPMDLASLDKWDDYTEAKEAMFFYTDTADAPWTVVKSNDKKRARLEAMRHVLSRFDYDDKDEPRLVGSGRRPGPDHRVAGHPHGDGPARPAPRRDRHVLGDVGEGHPLERLPVRLAGREVDQLVDQVGEFAGLLGEVGDQFPAGGGRQFVDPAEHRDVGAQGGQGRTEFVARVLDEAPLVLLGLGETAQHPVEGTAEPRHLVVPGDRHLDAEPPGAGHVLRGPGEPDEPRGDAPGQPPAEETGGDHHGAHQQHGPLLEFAQQVLRVAELLRDLHRAPPVAERDGGHPVHTVTDVDVTVFHQLAGRPRGRDPPVVGADGQRRDGPGRRPTRPARAPARPCRSA
jgi:hypothetical protein